MYEVGQAMHSCVYSTVFKQITVYYSSVKKQNLQLIFCLHFERMQKNLHEFFTLQSVNNFIYTVGFS